MDEEKQWLEAKYGDLTRREARAQRKEKRSRDRSKYKKSDQDKIEQRELSAEELANAQRGRVVTIYPEGIHVDSDGTRTVCVLRGVLKKERTQDKNIVTVGDYVYFEETSEGEGCIIHVEPRSTVLARAETLSQKKQQLLAANVDQVLITTSVNNPPLKPFLVDRYIISARKGGLTPVVVINKVDLLADGDEEDLFEEMLRAYDELGVKVIPVSSETGEGLDALQDCMRGSTSVFSGQSGVGKSSLINAMTGLDLETRETVARTRKGSHTTTRATLLTLPFGGWCVDTPGIKSFGVWDLQIDEIRHYFTDIQAYADGCRFPGCTHIHEPDCAVLEAVEEGKISPLRYDSYLQLTESLESEHKRR